MTGILPGHGRMVRFLSIEERRASIMEAAKVFEEDDETEGMFGVGYY